jgi:hypothetical protein
MRNQLKAIRHSVVQNSFVISILSRQYGKRSYLTGSIELDYLLLIFDALILNFIAGKVCVDKINLYICTR